MRILYDAVFIVVVVDAAHADRYQGTQMLNTAIVWCLTMCSMPAAVKSLLVC